MSAARAPPKWPRVGLEGRTPFQLPAKTAMNVTNNGAPTNSSKATARKPQTVSRVDLACSSMVGSGKFLGNPAVEAIYAQRQGHLKAGDDGG